MRCVREVRMRSFRLLLTVLAVVLAAAPGSRAAERPQPHPRVAQALRLFEALRAELSV